MAVLTQTRLKQIIAEEIQRALREGLTPEKRKELNAKSDDLYDDYQKVEEEHLDIENDIAKVESDIEDAKGNAGKAPLKKKLAALKAEEETILKRMDTAWNAYAKVMKQLGKQP